MLLDGFDKILVLYEDAPPMQQPGPQPPQAPANGDEEAAPVGSPLDAVVAQDGDPVEFLPLKKYLLLQRAYDIKSKLDVRSLYSDELETVLKFANELSYDTLSRLLTGVLDHILIHLQSLSKSKDKRNE